MRSIFLQAPITGLSKTKLTFDDSIVRSTLVLTEYFLAIIIISGLVVRILLALIVLPGFLLLFNREIQP